MSETVLDILKDSSEILHTKQSDIHRHIEQILGVMREFQYHIQTIRRMISDNEHHDRHLLPIARPTFDNDHQHNLSDNLTTTSYSLNTSATIMMNNQSDVSSVLDTLLKNLADVMLDTQSTMRASTTAEYDSEQIQQLTKIIYDQNSTLNEKIDGWMAQQQEKSAKTSPSTVDDDNLNVNALLKAAIKTMDIACRQSNFECQQLNDNMNDYEDKKQTIESFVNKQNSIYEQSKQGLLRRMRYLKMQNENMEKQNQAIETLQQQFKDTTFN